MSDLSFGQYISWLRKEKSMSQRKLAESAGVTNSTVSRIEADLVNPDPVTLSKLALALGVEKSVLLTKCGYSEIPEELIAIARKTGDLSVAQREVVYKRINGAVGEILHENEIERLTGIDSLSKENLIDELIRVKAELAELKKRFGIDRQEAFLKAHKGITVKEFAAMLHGRDRQPNMTPDEVLLARECGFVVVYGESDDLVEFEGAIRAEGYTNPFIKDRPAGVLVLSENGRLLDDESAIYAEYIRINRNVIHVFYCSRDGLNWVFETDIPHETFLTYDGGYDEDFADFDDGFARCMVFELSALKAIEQDAGNCTKKSYN